MELSLPRINIFRKKIIAHFIDETGTFYKAKKKYTDNKFDIKISGEKHTYLVDPERIYWDFKSKKPVAFYHANNPIPLDLKHMKVNPEGINSMSLKRIMDDKVVSDLFNLDAAKQIKLLLYILLGNLLLTLISVLVQMGVIKLSVGA